MYNTTRLHQFSRTWLAGATVLLLAATWVLCHEVCMYFKGQKLKSGISIIICFIMRLGHMLGTWSSASLHCCEHFMSEALRSSLSIQHWNWLQATVVNTLYCISHDFVVTKTAMESLHNAYSKQQAESVWFDTIWTNMCSANADHSSPNRPRLRRQSLVI